MKTYLPLLSLLAMSLLFSCKKKDAEQPKPSNSPIATFNYTGKMEVSEFKVYKGDPTGGKEVSKDYTPEGLFLDRLKNFTPPSQLIFKSKDSLSQLPKRVEVDLLKYKFNGDTLKGHNRYVNTWEVYGFKSKKRLAYSMTFYIYTRVSPPYLTAAVGTEHGLTLAQNMFRSEGVNFRSPAEMTNTNDLVGWYNVSYIYEGDKEL
ncbi:hypothetical protein [Pedobacter sp. Hv1]|uniref:hypothetical protein n=1 Tax=Pedobacter sp. Hv1 TaxID=1740090 RepID=UPI0006D8CC66|nr:hypothetical protein [Pedobacter sp. Hv1]KQC02670.1 hypothetical protein AQF98_03595 [Pedobacter sp. Hv1]